MDEIKELRVGDRIKCADSEDMLNTMRDLMRAGIDTDFDYRDGLALVVTKIWKERKQ